MAKKKKLNLSKIKPGDRIAVPVAQLEFFEGGNTIWIHSAKGATVLRIQVPHGKKVTVNKNECSNIVSHADIQTQGDVGVCLAEDAEVN